MYCNFVTGACISLSCICFCSHSVPWARTLVFIVRCNLFKLNVWLHTNSALIQNTGIATAVAAPLNIICDQIVQQHNVHRFIFSSMFRVLIILTFIHTWIGPEWYFVFDIRSTIVQQVFFHSTIVNFCLYTFLLFNSKLSSIWLSFWPMTSTS